jgi:hypothetical protein
MSFLHSSLFGTAIRLGGSINRSAFRCPRCGYHERNPQQEEAERRAAEYAIRKAMLRTDIDPIILPERAKPFIDTFKEREINYKLGLPKRYIKFVEKHFMWLIK